VIFSFTWRFTADSRPEKREDFPSTGGKSLGYYIVYPEDTNNGDTEDQKSHNAMVSYFNLSQM